MISNILITLNHQSFKKILYFYLCFCLFILIISGFYLSSHDIIACISAGLVLIFIGLIYYFYHQYHRYTGVLIFLLSWSVFQLFRVAAVYLPIRFDSILLTWDTLLFSKSLPLYFNHNQPNVYLTDFLSFCYLYLFPLQLCSSLYWATQKDNWQFHFGILIIFSVGFLSYFIFPAQGAYQAFPEQFIYPPSGGVITDFLIQQNQTMMTGIDVFPSLHTAFAVYIGLFFLIKRKIRISFIILPLNIGLIIATLYFAYHYGVDMVAGIFLGLIALYCSQCFSTEHGR